MLRVDRVGKQYGGHRVLADASLTVGEHEKVALIGPNGCGKSTLARLIAGIEAPDAGSVSGAFAGLPDAYLPQGAFAGEVADAASAAPAIERLWRLGHRLAAREERGADEALALADAFEAQGGWPAFADLEGVLRGLGLAHLPPDRAYDLLSGGERARLGLAALLSRPAPFLLLDEPSNHLDLEAQAWLQRWLQQFRGSVLLISHDRALVDAVVSAVYALTADGGGPRRFAGGYSGYLAAVAQERESQLDAYRRQQDEIRRVREDIRRVKAHAARFDATSANDYHRRIGKKVARTAKVRERKLERTLDSQAKVEKPAQHWGLKAEIAGARRGGEIVAELREIDLAFAERVIFDRLSLELRNGERVVISGPNGCGKTTLLRVLLGQQPPDRGSARLGAGVVPGYLSQQHEGLTAGRSALMHVREAAPLDEGAARAFLHRFLFGGDEALTAVERLSYGQRARLALGLLVLRGVNLLVLDEPMNHLDIESSERFEEALAEFRGTVIAVSHDRHFIQRFARRLLDLRDGRLEALRPEAI
ncbi:MAG TPA: ABC-F family ATP-binding cassette domain-containing protein [Dehalococcoidia bacterium]|nr:ABC-F family ATP-binding cassette domain-containing protein [Dehalococcoidia bacterium]